MQHPLLATRLLDSLLDKKVPCMLSVVPSSPDSYGVSVLETLLFIAAASAIPFVAKTKISNEMSRRRPIIDQVSILWCLLGGLVFNYLFMRQLYTRIESALFNIASNFIAYPGVAKPTCGQRVPGFY